LAKIGWRWNWTIAGYASPFAQDLPSSTVLRSLILGRFNT
jgi:hypothetical protein